MSFLRVAVNTANAIKISRRNKGAASHLRCISRLLSTEAQAPTQGSSPLPYFGSSSSDTFLRNPSDGLHYGRLLGITWHTTKTDILNLLDGCNLTVDDVKVSYDRNYVPTEMVIQFPSFQDYNAAVRSIRGKGRFYRLDQSSRNQWDIVRPYDGKAILMLGIPRNAQMDDVERFLSGTMHDSSSVQVFFRQGFPEGVRVALVRYPSHALALNAFITKNLGFCLNNKIWIQVLH